MGINRDERPTYNPLQEDYARSVWELCDTATKLEQTVSTEGWKVFVKYLDAEIEFVMNDLQFVTSADKAMAAVATLRTLRAIRNKPDNIIYSASLARATVETAKK